MLVLHYVLASLLVIATLLPKIPSTHWVFRTADFGKIQIFYLALLTFGLVFFTKRLFPNFLDPPIPTFIMHHLSRYNVGKVHPSLPHQKIKTSTDVF